MEVFEFRGFGLLLKGSFFVRRSRCDFWFWLVFFGGYIWGDVGRGVGSGLVFRGFW